MPVEHFSVFFCVFNLIFLILGVNVPDCSSQSLESRCLYERDCLRSD